VEVSESLSAGSHRARRGDGSSGFTGISGCHPGPTALDMRFLEGADSPLGHPNPPDTCRTRTAEVLGIYTGVSIPVLLPHQPSSKPSPTRVAGVTLSNSTWPWPVHVERNEKTGFSQWPPGGRKVSIQVYFFG
jgi:hypothetical protein